MKALASNRLVNSVVYPKILHRYNEALQAAAAEGKKVNNKKFYEEVVLPELPGYHLQSWYQFLKRFKTEAGLIAATIDHGAVSTTVNSDVVQETQRTLLTVDEATKKGIALALNIGYGRLQQLMEHPELMTAKEASDLLFKAMKAQDSRIHAIGKVREDNREEEKMARAFDQAAY